MGGCRCWGWGSGRWSEGAGWGFWGGVFGVFGGVSLLELGSINTSRTWYGTSHGPVIGSSEALNARRIVRGDFSLCFMLSLYCARQYR